MPDHQLDGAAVGELHRVGEQIAQHLKQPLLVGVECGREFRRHPYGEIQPLFRGQRPERRLHVVDQLNQGDPGRTDVHLARLDLRQIEDVVDQLEQVGTGPVDRLGEFHLLRRQIALGVVRQKFGQNEQRVEWRPQLVRHVRQELRLVTHGDGELLGALLQDLPRLLDLGVLDLDVAVLLGQQLGLLLQFGIGRLEGLLPVLQLLRPVAQLLRELLRLLQQLLGRGVDADRVDAGRDHLGQLVEEVALDMGEGLEGGQLDHAEDLPLEEHRQHDHMRGRCLAETGGDLQVPRRHVVHLDRPLLLGGRTDECLPGPEGRGHGAGGVAVTAPHPEFVRALPLAVRAQRVGVSRRHGKEEGAVLRRDDRGQLAHDERGDVVQVSPPLHQTGDPGQVALEPVLLLVGGGGVAQVGDHRVDVVLERLDLSGGVHVDLEIEIAAGHRGRDGRDGAHLTGQVPGHLVHRLGEVAPGSVDVPHPRLAAQLALGAHLAGDPGHLLGERGQPVDHRVDGVLQFLDLTAGIDVDLLGEVALGDGRGDGRDLAHLTGQVGRHRVH